MTIQSDTLSDLTSAATEPVHIQCSTKDNTKRNTKKDTDHLFVWFEFLNKNKSKSIDDFSVEQLPKSGNKIEGYFIHVKSVTPWPVPKKLKRLMKEKHVTFSISMTFFHGRSQRFFGNTWIGSEHHVTSLGKCDSFNLNEIVYFRSKIVDPTCYCVIELVATEYWPGKSTPARLYGCGWSLINPFTTEVADGITFVHHGTPNRLLRISQSELESLFNCSPVQSSIKYDTSKYEILNQIQSKLQLFDHNEIIGAIDTVPGFSKQYIEYPDGRGIIHENCLGASISKEKDSWSVSPPKEIVLCQLLKLDLSEIQIIFHNMVDHDQRFMDFINESILRNESQHLKKKKTTGMKRFVKNGLKSLINSSKANNICRRIKCSVHNGHCYFNSNIIELEKDKTNKDCLRAKTNTSVYYVKHPLCVLVMTLEYSIKYSRIQPDSNSTETLPNNVSNSSKMDPICLGSIIYLPFDGKHLRLSKQADENFTTKMSLENDEMHRVLAGTNACPSYRLDSNSKDSDATIYFKLSCRDASNNMEQVDETKQKNAAEENEPEYILALKNKNHIIKDLIPSNGSTQESTGRPKDMSKENEADRNQNDETIIKNIEVLSHGPYRCASPNSILSSPSDLTASNSRNDIQSSNKEKLSISREKHSVSDPDEHDFGDSTSMSSTDMNITCIQYDESFFQSTKFNEIGIRFDSIKLFKHSQPLPLSVFFTFSLHKFPEEKTELFYKNEVLSNDSNAFFTTLQQKKQEESGADEKNHYHIFSFDIHKMSFDEKQKYFEYIMQKCLIVDVWDGDSLILIGTIEIPLHYLLRPNDDIILRKEFNVKKNTILMSDNDSNQSHMDNITGKIIMELMNIDRPPDTRNNIGADSLHSYDQTSFNRPRKVRARPLLHTNNELMDFVHFLKKTIRKDTPTSDSVSTFPFSLQNDNTPSHNKFRARQLDVISVESKNRAISNHHSFFDQRLDFFRKLMRNHNGAFWDDILELKATEWFRQGMKEDFIKTHLTETNTCEQVTVKVHFGQAVLVELDILNSFDRDEIFRIDYSDTNLRVLFKADEIAFFKRNYHQSEHEPTSDLLSSESISFDSKGRPQIAVGSKQNSKVSFILLFDDINTMKGLIDNNVQNHIIGIQLIGKTFNDILKSYELIATLSLPIIHKTIHIASIQRGFLRKRVCFSGNNEQKYDPEEFPLFKCVTKKPGSIFCEWDNNESLPSKHIYYLSISCCCEIRREKMREEAYIFLYNDKFCTTINECWRVIVHPYLIINQRTIIGQELSYDLDIRRNDKDCQVSLFCDNNDVKIKPQTFQMNCEEKNSPKITHIVWKEGTHHSIVHLVDTENKDLIQGWILQTNCSKPMISSEYDLVVKIGDCKTKRMPLTNHWPETKRFTIFSSNEALVLPQTTTIEIGPSSTEYIKLDIVAPEKVGIYDIYLFLQGEKTNKKHEDTYLLKLCVKQ